MDNTKMEYVELNNVKYGFARNFKHDHRIRRSFNDLTQATFGFSLEQWYQDGLWSEDYAPHALLLEDKVVSNVSINRITFVIENETKTGIQIGTVMTDQQYRHKGLNKFLLEQVINEWSNKSDFIYLFANDSVLDFYPKYNFERVEEYQPFKSVDHYGSQPSLYRLNMENKDDESFLVEMIKKSVPISKISMRNNDSLIMFYCKSFKKNSIFYIKELKAIAIADIVDDTLYLDDIFTEKPIDLNKLIQIMSNEKIKKAVLGFTPLQEMGFEQQLLTGTDTLFMLKGTSVYFKNHSCMFPVLSHA